MKKKNIIFTSFIFLLICLFFIIQLIDLNVSANADNSGTYYISDWEEWVNRFHSGEPSYIFENGGIVSGGLYVNSGEIALQEIGTNNWFILTSTCAGWNSYFSGVSQNRFFGNIENYLTSNNINSHLNTKFNNYVFTSNNPQSNSNFLLKTTSSPGDCSIRVDKTNDCLNCNHKPIKFSDSGFILKPSTYAFIAPMSFRGKIEKVTFAKHPDGKDEICVLFNVGDFEGRPLLRYDGRSNCDPRINHKSFYAVVYFNDGSLPQPYHIISGSRRQEG